MTPRFVCLCLLLGSLAWAREVSRFTPNFPRIGNCYPSGIGWRTWEQGSEYWSKLDLFIGGGYDLHYDWDNPRWEQRFPVLEANIARLRQANPNALVLPYVDVIEGVKNPATPAGWWDLNAWGERYRLEESKQRLKKHAPKQP